MALQKSVISVIRFGTDGNDNFLGIYPTLLALQTAHPTGSAGNFAYVDGGAGVDIIQYIWDDTDSEWIAGGTANAVTSVNGDTGPIVVLVADNISDATSSNKWSNATEKTKLGFITVTSPADLDQMQTDLANTVRLTGDQSVDGRKTFSALTLVSQIVEVVGSTIGFKRNDAGSTDFRVEGNDANNAATLTLANGNGSTISLNANNGLASLDVGTYSAFVLNGNGIDVDTIIRGLNNDNLFVVDAGQDAVGIGGAPSADSILDVQSTTKGFKPPRMTTTQRLAIASPAAGLVVFDTTINRHMGYNGTTWSRFYYGSTYGEWRITTTNGVATVLTQNVPAKLVTGGNDTFINVEGADNDGGTPNRIRVNEAEVATFEIQLNVGLDKVGGGNEDFEVEVYRDGSPMSPRLYINETLGRDDETTLKGVDLDVPAGAHFYEAWITETSGSDNIVLTTGQMSVKRIK